MAGIKAKPTNTGESLSSESASGSDTSGRDLDSDYEGHIVQGSNDDHQNNTAASDHGIGWTSDHNHGNNKDGGQQEDNNSDGHGGQQSDNEAGNHQEDDREDGGVEDGGDGEVEDSGDREVAEPEEDTQAGDYEMSESEAHSANNEVVERLEPEGPFESELSYMSDT